MNYLRLLKNLGLKEEEAEIYLALLKLGLVKVSELVSEVNLPRTSIYMHLKNLVVKGYAKKSRKNRIEYFSPIEPKVILQEEEQKIKDFSAAVPLLETLSDFPKQKAKVEYFETVQGITRLYEAMLDYDYKHIPFLIESAITTKANFTKIDESFWVNWESKFLQKKVVTQGIITNDTIPIIVGLPDDIKKAALERPATVRVIDQREFPLAINLYLLYPDLVFIIISQEDLVIRISNKNLYSSLVSFYKALYEQGRPLNLKDLS